MCNIVSFQTRETLGIKYVMQCSVKASIQCYVCPLTLWRSSTPVYIVASIFLGGCYFLCTVFKIYYILKILNGRCIKMKYLYNNLSNGNWDEVKSELDTKKNELARDNKTFRVIESDLEK